MTSASTACPRLVVLVADSNRMRAQLLTSALRRHSEFLLCSCPLDPSSIWRTVVEEKPGIALLSFDPAPGIADDIMILRRFHLSHPEIPKVLLLDTCDRAAIVSAFRSGARGVFTFRDANLRLLCRCLLSVAAGQVWATSEQLNYVLDLVAEVPSLRVLNTNGNNLLTPREEQVVALVAEGLGNRQIADELDLSEHTVKKYLFRIFEKLGVSTRVELVLYALNHGDPRPAEWLAGAGPIVLNRGSS